MTTDSRSCRTEPGAGYRGLSPAGPLPDRLAGDGLVPGPGQAPARNGSLARPAAMAVLPSADLLGLAAASIACGHAVRPAVAYSAVVIAALAASGLYRRHITGRVSAQAGRIAAAAAIGLPAALPWLSAGGALRLAVAAALAVVVGRDLAYRALRTARRHDLMTEPALLVGAGEVGAQIADLLRVHTETGLRPIGFIDAGSQAHDLPLPVIGEPAEIPEIVVRYGIRRVIVSWPAGGAGHDGAGHDGGDQELVRALRACRRLPADICVVPRLAELGTALPRACLDEIWGIPLIPLRRTVPASVVLKRAFDVLAAAILLAAFSPALLVLAALIRLRSGRPVIFRQARVTRDGRIATIMKLRTLPEHADSDTRWSVPTEQLTGLGRWLRASHLDELPQLVNVLRGEMSLIGPRPERPYFADCFAPVIPGYSDRHRMRAGLTGWAQVHGLHGDTPIDDRVRFDNHYIENWSVWLDAVILLRTLGAALPSRRAGRR